MAVSIDKTATLRANTKHHEPLVLIENHPNDSRVRIEQDTCQTLSSRMGTGGGNTPLVLMISGYSAETEETDTE